MMTYGVQALHGMAAMMLRAPEMECNSEEAEMIADPLVRLMDHYAVTPPPEAILFANLLTGLAFVEGPRIAMIRMRKAEERAEKDRNMKRVFDTPVATETGEAGLGASFGGYAPGSGMAN